MQDKHALFLDLAERVATESSCISKKVGCLIVRDTRIISMGYNGTPSGYINCNRYFLSPSSIPKGVTPDNIRNVHHQWSNIHEIHAEMNAIMFAAKNGISVDGATLYCNYFPCQHCLKNIVQSGIISIVYKNDYDLGEYDEEFMRFIRDRILIINCN